MRPTTLLVSLALAGMAGSAAASEADNYRLERTPEGYVRMDTRTGEMMLCAESAAQLVCRKAVEAPSAPLTGPLAGQAEIDALKAEVRALDRRVVELEGSLAQKFEKSLPTEEDFNKSLSYMERFFRSFMGIVKDFENETSPRDAPPADRT